MTVAVQALTRLVVTLSALSRAAIALRDSIEKRCRAQAEAKTDEAIRRRTDMDRFADR
jgi:hypothetical protein